MSENPWEGVTNIRFVTNVDADQYRSDMKELMTLRAENARLTAQVAAADALRGRVAYATGIASDGTWKVLTEALKAYDAATAPADAEQPVPLDPFRREWIRETEEILAKHGQRLDELNKELDDDVFSLTKMFGGRLDELAARVDLHSNAIAEHTNRLFALESARQRSQPIPSAPVEVTDALVKVAWRAYISDGRSRSDACMKRALEAAFAERDREGR
jgi:hypothetical protein